MRKAGVGLTLLLLAALAWLALQLTQAPAKVVLISLDGAADGLVDDYLERGVLPAEGALAQLARTGARAEAMLPVTPSMTATSHVTLFTGAYPERHSIVSNNYHTAGDPITRSTNGSTAHIRVNLAGRESNGVVPPEKLEEYVERIVAACEGLRDPVTGEPIFERVLRNSELGEVHLGHPRTAGDVWVNARPGDALSGRIEPLALRARDKPLAPVLEPTATLRGQHGYLGTNREVQAIFFAGGPKVRPGGIGTVHHVDVAPTVSALLGIEPPTQNQGRNVLQPVR